MVSEKVEIITKSYREDAQAVRWECDGSPEYELTEVDKAEQRNRDRTSHKRGKPGISRRVKDTNHPGEILSVPSRSGEVRG